MTRRQIILAGLMSPLSQLRDLAFPKQADTFVAVVVNIPKAPAEFKGNIMLWNSATEMR